MVVRRHCSSAPFKWFAIPVAIAISQAQYSSAATFVSDTYAGVGFGHFNYRGHWEHVRSRLDGRILGTSSRSATPGSTVTFSFFGDFVHVYGVRGPGGGRGAVTLDGKRYPDIDFYSATKQPHSLVFDSLLLRRGVHILTIAVIGDVRAPGHHSSYINISGAIYI
jgi:hypothetical protein